VVSYIYILITERLSQQDEARDDSWRQSVVVVPEPSELQRGSRCDRKGLWCQARLHSRRWFDPSHIHPGRFDGHECSPATHWGLRRHGAFAKREVQHFESYERYQSIGTLFARIGQDSGSQAILLPVRAVDGRRAHDSWCLYERISLQMRDLECAWTGRWTHHDKVAHNHSSTLDLF
jgi:hypothetical protein